MRRAGHDGVMIGRGAQGRPWFIAQAIDYLATRNPRGGPRGPAGRLPIVLDHYDALLSHYGVEKGRRIARKSPRLVRQGPARRRAVPGIKVMREDDPAAVRRLVTAQFEATAEAEATSDHPPSRKGGLTR